MEQKQPILIIPGEDKNLVAACLASEKVREQLRQNDALDMLRKAAQAPNADPRELTALAMKVDPFVARNVGPNRKQRRAMLARDTRNSKRVRIQRP